MTTGRVVVDGKHLAVDGRPFRVRGVTYGSFLPRLDGEPFPERTQAKLDFQTMTDAGLNTIRTYELPPPDVLDAAQEVGLHVLVGLHHHDWRMEASPGKAARRRIGDAGCRAVDAALERCAPFPHVIGIAVGNEVPADVVRVHGIAAVEDALGELVARVHAGHDDLLATYVNFPTTEYLAVDGQDLICFNVFLEDPDPFRRYLRHLQVVAGQRPLLVTELGLASEVHGETAQAASLDAQLRIVDESGCAGATVFSWTDEWGVAGRSVEGWGFGITTGCRRPKPAFDVVTGWANRDLGDLRPTWPRISVIVCAYNEETTIEECLESLRTCLYPELEVIVCDDGSTDRTSEICGRYPFRVLALDHGGLSRARNAGLAAATGEIVAYLDADAACHADWPFYLALSMEDDGVVATGGPNLPVVTAGFVERAVALAPGGPLEVLVSDDRAEHVPGCNMAYRRHALEAISGFDPVYTAAGDDVDVCWKLLERGQEIAFAHAAQVHHHRRATARGYLRQQRGYGKAEKMLTGAHPHRFNRLGQARWKGFIYGGAAILPSLLRPVVYHGHQGAAPFQPVARRRAENVTMWLSALLPVTLPVALIGIILAVFLSPWWLLLTAAMLVGVLAYGAAVAAATTPDRTEPSPGRLRLVVGALHVAQPLWRTWGRLRGRPAPARPKEHPAWSGDRWAWLGSLEHELRTAGCHVQLGGPRHSWDLRATTAPFASASITTAVMWSWEPHVRVVYRSRLAFWGAVSASAAVGIAFGPVGWIALSVVAAVTGLMALDLRRRVSRAVAHTTRGACSS